MSRRRPKPENPREEQMKIHRRWPAFALLALIATVALVSTTTSGASSRAASGSITVWVDAVRLPVAKLYVKTHKNVHVKLVTYDGDGNGATTMQTKIQLWNRTGRAGPTSSSPNRRTTRYGWPSRRSTSPSTCNACSRRLFSRAGPRRLWRSAP